MKGHIQENIVMVKPLCKLFKDSKKLAVEKNNEILYLEYISDSQNLTGQSGAKIYSVCKIKS